MSRLSPRVGKWSGEFGNKTHPSRATGKAPRQVRRRKERPCNVILHQISRKQTTLCRCTSYWHLLLFLCTLCTIPSTLCNGRLITVTSICLTVIGFAYWALETKVMCGRWSKKSIAIQIVIGQVLNRVSGALLGGQAQSAPHPHPAESGHGIRENSYRYVTLKWLEILLWTTGIEWTISTYYSGLPALRDINKTPPNRLARFSISQGFIMLLVPDICSQTDL